MQPCYLLLLQQDPDVGKSASGSRKTTETLPLSLCACCPYGQAAPDDSGAASRTRETLGISESIGLLTVAVAHVDRATSALL